MKNDVRPDSTTLEARDPMLSATLGDAPSDLAEEASPPSGRPRDEESRIVTSIKPLSGWHLIDVRELLRYRELMYYLAWRDVAVRYKQTLLGVIWAIVPAILLMFMFTLVFGKVAKFPTPVPYPLWAITGLVPWLFFTKVLSGASGSVIGAQGLVDKVYFPRLVLPFSQTGEAIFDLFFTLIAMAGVCLFYQAVPGWRLLLAPLLLILTAVCALGFGTFLAALNVSFRDIRHMVPFVLQLAMYATPAIYMDTVDARKADMAPTATVTETRSEHLAHLATDPHAKPQQSADSQPTSQLHEGNTTEQHHERPMKESAQGVVPDSLQSLMFANPMMGIVNSFRAAILDRPIPWLELAYSTTVSLLMLFLSCLYFQRVENTFTDIL